MTATDIATLIAAFAGLLTVYSAYRASARKSDVDYISVMVSSLQTIVTSLQTQLTAANARIAYLEDQHIKDEEKIDDAMKRINDLEDMSNQDKKLITRLTDDLHAATERLKQLEAGKL